MYAVQCAQNPVPLFSETMLVDKMVPNRVTYRGVSCNLFSKSPLPIITKHVIHIKFLNTGCGKPY